MKFCANLNFMFLEHSDLRDRYRAAQAAGFTGVEVGFPYSVPVTDLAQVRLELGMEQVLVNTFPGDTLGFGARAGEEEQFKESLVRSLEYCQALDCHRLHIMAGRKVEGGSREEAMETFRSNLETSLPLLEKAGVVGLLEPINQFSVPGYILDNYSDAVSLVEGLASPWIRLQLDIFHLQQIEGNVSRRIQELLPLVGHIQIAQVPDRGEPDSPGELNYRFLLSLLEKLNYKGWVGLEYKPLMKTETGLSWVEQFGYSL